jgi:hypothetical protein
MHVSARGCRVAATMQHQPPMQLVDATARGARISTDKEECVYVCLFDFGSDGLVLKNTVFVLLCVCVCARARCRDDDTPTHFDDRRNRK